MFNLIMGGSPDVRDHWPIHTYKRGEDDFPLSRMLEGTPEHIYKKLSPLTDTSLKFMEKLPVLFMTEVYRNYSDENTYEHYISIRTGKISSARIEKKSIAYNFVIDEDFGEVLITDENVFTSALDLGSFGLSRTHWAVKDKDLKATLVAFGIKEPEFSGINSFPENLPEKSDTNPVITSVESFLKIIFSNPIENGEEIFYRGHSDTSYELVPSLFRKNLNGNYRYLSDEDNLVREILTSQPAEFHSDKYMLDKLVRMQHYGLPTRLLDITSNPLIALYFACLTDKSQGEEDKDGQVMSFRVSNKVVKFYESDTVSCITNLSMLPHQHKSKLSRFVEVHDLNETKECKKLVHFIREEKPYFSNEINPSDLSRVLFVRGRVSNVRISSQSGAFLLFGNDAVLPENDEQFPIGRVTVKNKNEILSQLARLNINEGTVYPGIEKAATEIAKKYRNEQ